METAYCDLALRLLFFSFLMDDEMGYDMRVGSQRTAAEKFD